MIYVAHGMVTEADVAGELWESLILDCEVGHDIVAALADIRLEFAALGAEFVSWGPAPEGYDIEVDFNLEELH